MKVDVVTTAKLANLPLSDTEKNKFEKQLEETLRHVSNLSEINTNDVEPTSQVTGLENVSRDDQTAPSLSQNEALKNSKSAQNGLFKVKGVLNNG